jgi:hypothetical protein
MKLSAGKDKKARPEWPRIMLPRCRKLYLIVNYEEEPISGSQLDIKRKTCVIRTWEKHLFLYISFTNIDTPVPSLYQCVETRSTEVF